MMRINQFKKDKSSNKVGSSGRRNEIIDEHGDQSKEFNQRL